MHPLLLPKTDKKQFLLGNEAIVRGALEGGVRFVAAYPGTPSSEIIERFHQVAADPLLHSSQNEQDSRYYAKISGVPMLEPSTPEEARLMTIQGLELSERYGTPCMLRTTTR